MPTALDPPPCHGRMLLFLVPVDDDNPAYDPVKAKALCATCPAEHKEPCDAGGKDDDHLIRAGLTPTERAHGLHNRRPAGASCVRCGRVDWYQAPGSSVRTCRFCKSERDKAAYRARLR